MKLSLAVAGLLMQSQVDAAGMQYPAMDMNAQDGARGAIGMGSTDHSMMTGTSTAGSFIQNPAMGGNLQVVGPTPVIDLGSAFTTTASSNVGSPGFTHSQMGGTPMQGSTGVFQPNPMTNTPNVVGPNPIIDLGTTFFNPSTASSALETPQVIGPTSVVDLGRAPGGTTGPPASCSIGVSLTCELASNAQPCEANTARFQDCNEEAIYTMLVCNNGPVPIERVENADLDVLGQVSSLLGLIPTSLAANQCEVAFEARPFNACIDAMRTAQIFVRGVPSNNGSSCSSTERTQFMTARAAVPVLPAPIPVQPGPIRAPLIPAPPVPAPAPPAPAPVASFLEFWNFERNTPQFQPFPVPVPDPLPVLPPPPPPVPVVTTLVRQIPQIPPRTVAVNQASLEEQRIFGNDSSSSDDCDCSGKGKGKGRSGSCSGEGKGKGGRSGCRGKGKGGKGKRSRVRSSVQYEVMQSGASGSQLLGAALAVLSVSLFSLVL